jgi:hypothetical protein
VLSDLVFITEKPPQQALHHAREATGILFEINS